MKKIKVIALLLTIAVAYSVCSGMAVTDNGKYEVREDNSEIKLYVSTSGNDENDGSFEHPFLSIEAARDAIRDIKRSGKKPAGITVYIRGGRYSALTPIQIESQDSGTEQCPIVYCAYDDEDVYVSGGVCLNAKQFVKVSGEMKSRLRSNDAKNKVKVFDLSSLNLTSSDLGNAELFFNGKRGTIARYPNNDYTCLLCAPGECGPKNDLRGNSFGGATSYYSERDFALDSWTSYDGVVIVGYPGCDWSDCRCVMLGLDTTEKTFELGPGSGYGYKCYRDIYFENIYDEIDMPGEYYIDTENLKLYVYPTSSFNSDNIELSLNNSELLRINANYISIKGLSFCVSRNGGISASGNNITLDGNNVSGIRNTGISARGNYNYVINNNVSDLGKVGISVSGGSSDTLSPSRSIADNNCISNFAIYGKTYNPGISAHGNGIIISHNEIFDAPHMAVGYSGQNIIFEYNRIHDVCKETGDSGAIYAGRRWDYDSCIFRYNFIYSIHDILSIDDDGNETGHPNGLYWDDALSGQVAYGNVFADISGNAIYAGGGHHNVIYNNILVDVGEYNDENDPGKAFAIKYDTRASNGSWGAGLIPYNSGSMWGELSNFPYKSKLWQYKFPILSLLLEVCYNDPANPDVGGNNSYAIVRNNIVADKRTVGSFEGSFAKFSTLRDNVLFKSRYDVGFVDCDNYDFRLKSDSSALFLLPHFENLDTSLMGLRHND